MRLVTAKTIAAACEVSIEEVNREVKALWKSGGYDSKIFYTGLAQVAVFALVFGVLFGIANRFFEMSALWSYLGLGAIIFFGFRSAMYAAIEPAIKARFGQRGRG